MILDDFGMHWTRVERACGRIGRVLLVLAGKIIFRICRKLVVAALATEVPRFPFMGELRLPGPRIDTHAADWIYRRLFCDHRRARCQVRLGSMRIIDRHWVHPTPIRHKPSGSIRWKVNSGVRTARRPRKRPTKIGTCVEKGSKKRMYPLAVGLLLGAICAGVAMVAGLDRARASSVVLLIAIAVFYVVFAVEAETHFVSQSLVSSIFVLAALVSYRTSLWGIAIGLATHALYDALSPTLGAPAPHWWPMFCLGFDVVLACAVAVWLATGRLEARAP